MKGPIRTLYVQAAAALERGGEGAGQLPPGTARYRDILLVVLTLTTGALDAVTFLRLGNVFSSVITGNLGQPVWPI